MWPAVLNIILKVLALSCQMKVKGTTLVSMIKQPKVGITRDETNADNGTVVATSNADGKPGSRGENLGSMATSTIGQGSERPNGSSEQLEKSAPTSESYTTSTQQPSQEL